MIDYEKILVKFEEFPTLPTIYVTLSEVMDNPRSTPDDASDVISRDQSAAAKILKVSNSAIYGLQGKVSNISDAIKYIGFQEVKNLVFALSVIKIFDFKSGGILNPIDLWKHSLGVGVITRLMGKLTGAVNIENYFLAGILHDIGKLFLYKYFPSDYTDVVYYANKNKLTLREAEKTVLGITNSVLGGLIAEKWKLPVSIRDTIQNHDSGISDSDTNHLTGCVHIANIAACMLGLGFNNKHGYIPRPNKLVWKNLDLPEKAFSKLLPNIMQDYEISVNLMIKS